MITTDEIIKAIKSDQPTNITALTKTLGYEPSQSNVALVYRKVRQLGFDGIVKSKRVGAARIVWMPSPSK